VNAKLDLEKILKIFDFGLAREQHRDARTVGFVGTPGFAAPELFSFGHVEFTQAVDTYAFGVTALYLVKGDLPNELALRPPQPDQWIAAGGFRAFLSVPTRLGCLLDTCLAGDPSKRPTMAEVRDAFASHLLQDSHRALIVSGTRIAVCDRTTKTATMSASGLGAITLRYAGTHFEVAAVQGDARVNNQPVVVGMVIPGSCVATLGGSHLPPWKRVHVTIDVSHPEVVL
jgi:serine/threonine-protein kinase